MLIVKRSLNLLKEKVAGNIIFFLSTALLSVAITHNVHASSFDEISITYKLQIQSSSLGDATLGKLSNTLTKTSDGYQVKSETKAQGFAALLVGNEQQSCDFIMQDGYAIPQRYVGGSLKKQKYEVGFDWQASKLNFENGESLTMPKGYIVDLCSMPFALALQKGQGLESQIMYVVDGKKNRIRGYKLINLTEELIDTSIGKQHTLKIELQRELKSSKTLTLWLSKNNHYVPVKIEEKRKSRTVTMSVNELIIN